MLKINYYRLFLLTLFCVNSSNTLCSSFTQRDSDQNLPSLPLPSSTHNAHPSINPSGLGSDMPNNNTNFDSLLSDLFFANLRNTQQEVAHPVEMESTENLSDLAHTWHFNATLFSLFGANNNTLSTILSNAANTSTNISSVVAHMPHYENRESTITFSANADTCNHDIPLLTPDELSSSNTIPSVPLHTNRDKDHTLTNKKKKHPKKTYTCPTCHKNLATQSSFNYHIKTHNANRPKPYQCNICDKGFTKKSTLTTHLKRHSKEKTFKCDYCPKRFTTKFEKNQHNRIHTGEKPFRCNLCDKRFIQKSALKTHLKRHNKEKPFKCDYCPKRFTTKHEKNQHHCTHTGEKLYKCHICQRGLQSKGGLNDHLNKHLGKKPYKCDIGNCDKAYATSNGLKSHKKTHKRPKPYSCPYCSASFAYKREYESHIRYEEGTDEDRKCHICKKGYATKTTLGRHNKAVHSINSKLRISNSSLLFI